MEGKYGDAAANLAREVEKKEELERTKWLKKKYGESISSKFIKITKKHWTFWLGLVFCFWLCTSTELSPLRFSIFLMFIYGYFIAPFLNQDI